MNIAERMLKVMKADTDPVFFMEDPYFLGLKLWPKQKEIVRKFYSEGKRLLIWVSGMRSGKTFMLGAFAAYELYQLLTKSWESILNVAPGSPFFVTMVATAEKQIEDTAFYFLRRHVLVSPFFQEFKPRVITDSITFKLKPNVIVRALSTDSATIAGRTSKAVFIDEVFGLRDTEGPQGLMPVFRTLRNSTETFKEHGHTFVAGSLKENINIQKLYDAWKDSPEALCVKTPTWEVNPNLPREHFKELEARDPIGFWRDFGCEPYTSADVYYRDPSILVYSGVNKLQMLAEGLEPTVENTTYVLAGDPALKHDSFGLCLAHIQGDTYVIDGLYKFEPKKGEINPLEVLDFILKIVNYFPVRAAVFDTWHFAEAQERLRRLGIPVYNHIVRKPEHDRVKELFYKEKIKVPYYEPFDKEVRSLVVTPSMKVTHPRGGHDDVVSALANAVWLLDQKKPLDRPVLVEVI